MCARQRFKKNLVRILHSSLACRVSVRIDVLDAGAEMIFDKIVVVVRFFSISIAVVASCDSKSWTCFIVGRIS